MTEFFTNILGIVKLLNEFIPTGSGTTRSIGLVLKKYKIALEKSIMAIYR